MIPVLAVARTIFSVIAIDPLLNAVALARIKWHRRRNNPYFCQGRFKSTNERRCNGCLWRPSYLYS